MSTSRPFAYNPGSLISGTDQYGNLAVGVQNEPYADNYGGVVWWEGPDEDLGYVIAQTVPDNSQPTPNPFVFASVGFYRSELLNESTFISVANSVSGQIFTTGDQAAAWLVNNGYWTSWPVLTNNITLQGFYFPGSVGAGYLASAEYAVDTDVSIDFVNILNTTGTPLTISGSVLIPSGFTTGYTQIFVDYNYSALTEGSTFTGLTVSVSGTTDYGFSGQASGSTFNVTPTPTPSVTPSVTPTKSIPAATPSVTPSVTGTRAGTTPTPTGTPTGTPVAATPTPTGTPTSTPLSVTPTPTGTPAGVTPTPTATPTMYYYNVNGYGCGGGLCAFVGTFVVKSTSPLTIGYFYNNPENRGYTFEILNIISESSTNYDLTGEPGYADCVVACTPVTPTPTPTGTPAGVTPTPTSTSLDITPTPTETPTGTPTGTPSAVTPTPTPTSGATGDGWLFYYAAGASAGAPSANGNALFMNGSNSTYNPNVITELYFNVNTTNGTSYLTEFQGLDTSGGTITLSQGSNTVVLSGDSTEFFYGLGGSWLNLIVSNPAQYIQYASGAFSSGVTINLSVNAPILTPTPTGTVNVTPTPTGTPSVTSTPTGTPNETPTPTGTPNVTPSQTATDSGITPTPTGTNEVTPTPTSTVNSTSTPTGTPTQTPTGTPAGVTPTPTSTTEVTPTPTGTPSNVTPTPTPTTTTGLTPTPTETSTTPTPTGTPDATPTQTPTHSVTPSGFTVTIIESGGNVVMSASGSLNINDLTLAVSGAGPLGSGGIGVNSATFIMGNTGDNYDEYEGFTSTPSNFGTGGGGSSSSSSGDVFGVIFQGTPPYQLVVPVGYTTGTPISSTQTFNSATFASLGLVEGTYTYSWGSGANADSINVVVGGGGVTPTPTATSATPTPTPTSGATGDFTVTVSQQGPNVVWNGSGKFNLGALSFLGNPNIGAGYQANQAIWAIGPNVTVDQYQGTITYPTSFGAGGTPVTTTSGSTFGILPGGSGRTLYVPTGYTSNSVISGSATYANTTIATMGLSGGTYTWSWGSGGTASTIVMTITP